MNFRSETRHKSSPSKPHMVYRYVLPLALALCVADFPGSAQIGYPGGGIGYPGGGIGYPGGGIGYPGGGGGIPFPGRRRNQSNMPSDTLSGKIQRISTSQLVLTPDDGREITISLERSTKYFNTSGSNAKFGDFDAGDKVSVDAARDNQNYYHALRVTLQQKGGAANQTSSSDKSAENQASPARAQDSAPA
ncbi:MAG TPA: hypothetical protein VHB50_12730, partial [Bryobacteraceae bacterium]|nr:hypothetical protein [Bryobacteraceae bacterium]